MMFPQQTAAPAAPGQRLVAERRWRLGVHSRGHPHRIIEDLLRALHTLSVGYKKVAPYNYKCRKLYPARGNPRRQHSCNLLLSWGLRCLVTVRYCPLCLLDSSGMYWICSGLVAAPLSRSGHTTGHRVGTCT